MEKTWRNDAYAKVTGQALYTNDLAFPDMLHAVPVYADYVHAIIDQIHIQDAEDLDGVVKVITSQDIPGSNRHGQIEKDYRIFADDKIRYWGDVVALVVARDRKTAIEAAELVKVEATPLPSIHDPEAALKPDAILIHEEHGSNIINTHRIRRGDIEKGFDASDIIIEHKFQTQFVEHAYLEPEAALAVPRADGVIEIHGSMQHPFSTRRFTAALLGMRLSDVEVVGTPMGGGFGGKDDTAAVVCARTALAAKLLGKPVKVNYDREWSIRESYKRHPYRVTYKMGLSSDGLIKAVRCEIIADGGAYCSTTPWVTWRSTVQCCGPYQVDHVHCDTVGVYTNNVFTGAMRGFGSPQMNFVVEQMVELAAEKVGMSAVELRRKNMVQQGSATITGQVLDNHTVSMGEVLNAVIEDIDYDEKLKQCSFGKPEGDELYGIGLAMSYRGMSLGAEGADFCAAIINAQFDGSILLEVGIHENGQGAESAFILALAAELGVNRERIRYRQSSTSSIPDSGTTVASRGTLMGTGAVVRAADEFKKKMSQVVAPSLKCNPEEVHFKDDRLHGGQSDHSISFDRAIRVMYLNRKFPFAFGEFQGPSVTWDEKQGRGKPYFTWVYGCQAIELTVNKQTGRVKLLNAIAAHDVGRVVNPGMLNGQIYGGIAMGSGYALSEEVQLDAGKITNLNLNNYRILRSTDVPEMKAIVIENRDPNSPFGAKGIGEPTNEIMAPAIANAVYRATGKRFFNLPIKIDAQNGS
ncbi:xanthine dehydrogenase family protein molybdopterin-binding subunit [bacterium]|nr:xanthine dehydrogenase family protein molybdopterin-binding subunit [bacterium]MBU1652947.1 xanthine dehydrogenase family protein molybdopterin-binding subunit [bacterium]